MMAKHNLPNVYAFFFLVGLVGSVAMPNLEGLNHFALNWAFNEPKLGEPGERRARWLGPVQILVSCLT